MIDSFHGEYRFLSNFYPCEIEMDGIVYPSSEHAYQAAKTDDVGERRKISKMKSAGEAKRAGKLIKLRRDWRSVSLNIMYNLLVQKFDKNKNPDLYTLLKQTGDQKLVEGNTWGDTFWGVCDGVGENWLGKLLMKVRDL